MVKIDRFIESVENENSSVFVGESMIGPFHDFILLEWDEYDAFGYSGFFHDKRRVSISDDLIRYMLDTLCWIPSRNPSNEQEWKGYGLNLYGPTLISSEGGRIAAQILRHWIGLFMQAPSQFQLHSGFETTSGDHCREEEALTPHIIYIERDQCVKQLETIAGWAEKVSLDETYVLLHDGA